MSDYILERRKRKTLSLHLGAGGEVIVLAPMYLAQSYIDDFVRSHADWIEKHRKGLEAEKKSAEISLEEGGFVPFFGTNLPVKLWDKPYCVFAFDAVYLPIENREKALKDGYVRELKKYVKPILLQKQKEMGAVIARHRITSAKGRWGSCSSKKALCFCLYLAMCERWVVDYVIVHELAHTFEMNHSSKFWAIVEKYYPDYKKAKAYLKNKSYFLKSF